MSVVQVSEGVSIEIMAPGFQHVKQFQRQFVLKIETEIEKTKFLSNQAVTMKNCCNSYSIYLFIPQYTNV